MPELLSIGRSIDRNFPNNCVFAAILVVAQKQVKVLSLATGSGCLNKNQLSSEKRGFLVADYHAEIIARRSFSRWLLLEMHKKRSSFISQLENGKYSFPHPLYLVVSQAPCGDCCIDALEKSVSWQEAAQSLASIPVRGHSQLGAKGVVRTKPGRADSCDTESLSCSDKISNWIMNPSAGLESKKLASLVSSPIRLSGIFVGSRFNSESIERGLFTRFGKQRENFLIKKIESFGFEIGKPSDCCWWWNPNESSAEHLTKGQRRGSTKSSKMSAVSSLLCRDSLKRLVKETELRNLSSIKIEQT